MQKTNPLILTDVQRSVRRCRITSCAFQTGIATGELRNCKRGKRILYLQIHMLRTAACLSRLPQYLSFTSDYDFDVNIKVTLDRGPSEDFKSYYFPCSIYGVFFNSKITEVGDGMVIPSASYSTTLGLKCRLRDRFP
jgi:hypothetical protein